MKCTLSFLAIVVTLSFCGCKKAKKSNHGTSKATLTELHYYGRAGDVPLIPVAGGLICFASDAKGANSYHWDFGDGYYSNEAYPCHVFPKAGNYTVKLTLDDDDLVTATMLAKVAPPSEIVPSLAGKNKWRRIVVINDTPYSKSTDFEITYVNPATIRIGTDDLYLQSSTDNGIRAVLYFRHLYVGSLGHHESEITLIHNPTIDSVYYHYYDQSSMGSPQYSGGGLYITP